MGDRIAFEIIANPSPVPPYCRVVELSAWLKGRGWLGDLPVLIASSNGFAPSACRRWTNGW